MRPRSCVATGVLLAWLSHADARPTVVIVETRDAPALPALAAQVQTYAGREIAVRLVPDDARADALAAKAAHIVEREDATVVIWVASTELADPARERMFLVYAAGRWPGRALIELVRIDARTSPANVERTIALKIAGLLDVVTAPRPIGISLGIPVERPQPARWRIAIGGGLVRETGDRGWDGRLGVELARRWDLRTWALAAGFTARWQPSSPIAGDRGYVSIDELGLAPTFAAEHAVGRGTVSIGGHAALAVLIARGTSIDGPSGQAAIMSPYVGVEVGVRWPVSDTVELAVFTTAERAWYQQRLQVDAVVTADLERHRLGVGLGISILLR